MRVATRQHDVQTDSPEVTFAADVAERLRVIVVAGIITGIVVVGIGSRLAMFALRVTSPDSVRGVTSDDGFEIGRFTLGGSYNLVLIGAIVGMIGVVAYRAVSPWLLGPNWFRRATVAMASGAVVGSMLVHADGIDFTLLKPMWFAIALFVVLPMVFGVAIGVAVDAVGAPESWTRAGRRRWVLPLALLATVPLVMVFLAPIAIGTLVWTGWRRSDAAAAARRSLAIGLVVRGAWLTIAAVGLAALLGDIDELRG